MSDVPLDTLAIWDESSLMKRLLGKAALKEKLLKLFVQDFPTRLEQLQQALDAGDLVRVASASHALKGMSGNISGLRLQALTGRIEAAAKEGDAQTVAAISPDLTSMAQELLSALQTDLQGDGDGATSSVGGQAPPAPEKAKVSLMEFRDTLTELQGKLSRGEFVDPSGIPLLSTCGRQAVCLVSEAGEQVLEANLVNQTNELCRMIESCDFQPAISVVDGMMQLVAGERG